MAHAARTHVPGGLAYVVLRTKTGAVPGGDAGKCIFLDDAERQEFLRRLPLALDAAHVRLHGFCLTDGDVRLLLEVSDTPLGKCIQHVCSYFAHWANRRRGQAGHLFRQRYRAVPLTDRSIVPDVIRHIHRSALAAGLTRELDDYVWSSHRSYIGAANLPWVTTHRVLGMFGSYTDSARQLYRRYVCARNAPARAIGAPRAEAPEEFVTGDSKFIRWLVNELREDGRPATLEQIIEATCRRMQVAVGDLVSPSRLRRLSLARAVVTWQATRSGVATLVRVAGHFKRDPSTLYDGCERYRPLYPELFGIELAEFLRKATEPLIERRVRRAPRAGPSPGGTVQGMQTG
jgi:putative transposase